jgi:phenylalanyl-tRNA synthetase alpha chain
MNDSMDTASATQAQNHPTLLKNQAEQQIAACQSLQDLEQIRVNLLGKKGLLTEQLKQLGNMPPSERPAFGQAINNLKQDVQILIETKKISLTEASLNAQLQARCLDITLPGRAQMLGGLHPVTQTLQRITELFGQIGFSIKQGPEIEDDYHNFTALNIPEHHPARAMHDTFYFDAHRLLRTHTSPVQIRTMETQPPPLKIIAPGRVYRCDSDMTHTPMFHQVEGLMVDKNISFVDLKSILHDFLQQFFGRKLAIRFRPSYFPFTEPSAEVDVEWIDNKGKSSWLEVLGCGMVHPQVFDNVGIDNEEYTGFAFGMGVERFAMLYYGIPDLRMLFENDIRFLKQFN